MKLSELSTDHALDVLCELTPFVANICEDGDLVATLGEKIDLDENMNMYGQFTMLAGKIGKITPILLKTHRVDVYNILSVLNEKPVDEIAAQPIGDTIRQVREAFQDSELLSFFRSFVQRGQKEQSAPSADSHGSE